MSVHTKAALDAEIAAHLEHEADGAILTGYVLQTRHSGVDIIEGGLTGSLRIVAEGQSFTTSLGLVHYMMRSYDHDLTARNDDD